MEAERRPEGPDVESALVAWRRRAADVLLAAVAAVHLPPIVLINLGYGPPVGPLVRAAAIASYLVIVAAALLRRVEHRTRLWAALGAGYTMIAILNVAFPRGPYAQVGLVTLPIFGLVLLGAQAARIAVLACTIVLVSAPFLRVLPGVARALGIDPLEAAGPPEVVWFQTAVLGAYLLAMMILLDRFHRFLLDAMAARSRAMVELEREAAERSAAQRKMESEMRERQRLAREIASIGDKERRRLGQELHDGVCQQVTAALLRCQALGRRLERGGTLSGTDFETLSTVLAESIDEAYNVARGLCPLEPDPEALAPALRALAKRIQEISAVRCEFLEAGDVRVPEPAMAQHLYRIAQEALSNAVRHAHASRITIELRGSDGELTLQVEDNGAGLTAEPPTGGMGLRTMAYRALILEGELTVASAPSGGARVSCRVPRPAGSTHPEIDTGVKRWIQTT